MRWQALHPILVGKVLSPEDPDKDLVRNAVLCLQVPSFREYGLLDTREDADRPTLTVHRRHGRRWQIVEVGFGETYRTRLLPGFN